MWFSATPFFSRPWWTLTVSDVKEGINLHKKLFEALLQTKIKYIDVSKCDERNVVEVSHSYNKERYITIDELRKGVSRETFENVIVSGDIESLLDQLQVIWDSL